MHTETEIIEYLRNKFDPEAVVFFGSRALNRNGPKSDWDVYLLMKQKPENFEDLVFWDGDVIDILISDCIRDDCRLYVLNGKVPMNEMRIGYDCTNGTAESIIRGTMEEYEKGPSKPGLTQKANNTLFRRLLKLRDNKENPGVFFYNIGIFFEVAIRYWFDFKNEWEMPISKSLNYIAEKDPNFKKLLTKIYSGDIPEQLDGAEAIYEKLFGSFNKV
jgi:predicted nucleotidyltransferase